MIKRLFLLLFLLSAGTSVASAQDSYSRINVFGAGSILSGDRAFEAEGDVFRTDYKKGGKIGARFTMDITERLAGEAGYSYGRNSLRVNRLEPPRTTRTFETNLHQFSVNALYYFIPVGEDLRPFLTFGASLTHFRPTEEGEERASQALFNQPTRISSSTKLGINFGAGVEAAVNDWIGIRLDLRDHIIQIPRFGLPEIPLNPGGVSYPVSGVIQNVEAAVGVVFYLR